MKILFHIDDPAKWTHLQSNITNALAAQPSTAIVVVANGSGIQAYLTAEAKQFMANHQTVEFDSCRNSMKSHHITADQVAGTKIVPVGVLRIAELQSNGFAYIKL
ncbi:DsrE family protein [Secundilactobacillus folii]|uniref:DsrE family protein n=1 Tax=Secundilactobacillus folii TaxID=2678357 RepID=UPI001566C6B4|nr:DsrE family protein [Secundilactobacillus folii]